MQVKTKLNVDYMWRTALFGIVFTGWGLWSLYDGFVAYPQFNEKHGYQIYEQLREQAHQEAEQAISNAATAYEQREAVNSIWDKKYRSRFLERLRETDWWERYEAGARTEEGAPRRGLEAVRQLENKYHSPWDIRAQHFMAAVCLPIGLLALGSLALSAKRCYSADEEGLHGFARAPIPYDAVQSVDWSRWQRKGIVKLTASANGTTRTFKLDGWKYRGMTDILKAVEEKRPELERPPEMNAEHAEREEDPASPSDATDQHGRSGEPSSNP